MSRDPAQEDGGANLECLVSNDAVNRNDFLGLWATSVHHQIVEDWLNPKDNDNVDYHNYHWRCCTIDVIRAIQDGSDEVDGVRHNGVPWFGWCEAQSSDRSYQHEMRNGASAESIAQAGARYNLFLAHNLVQAVGWAQYAKENGRCYLEEWALDSLGRAYHSFSDGLSPAHAGFQPWWGPIDGVIDMGFWEYWHFVQAHEAKETQAVYTSQQPSIVAAVRRKFKLFLDYILQD